MQQPVIYWSVASYRDSELLPSLKSAFYHAHFPSRLRPIICWQGELHAPCCSCQYTIASGEDVTVEPFASTINLLDTDCNVCNLGPLINCYDASCVCWCHKRSWRYQENGRQLFQPCSSAHSTKAQCSSINLTSTCTVKVGDDGSKTAYKKQVDLQNQGSRVFAVGAEGALERDHLKNHVLPSDTVPSSHSAVAGTASGAHNIEVKTIVCDAVSRRQKWCTPGKRNSSGIHAARQTLKDGIIKAETDGEGAALAALGSLYSRKMGVMHDNSLQEVFTRTVAASGEDCEYERETRLRGRKKCNVWLNKESFSLVELFAPVLLRRTSPLRPCKTDMTAPADPHISDSDVKRWFCSMHSPFTKSSMMPSDTCTNESYNIENCASCTSARSVSSSQLEEGAVAPRDGQRSDTRFSASFAHILENECMCLPLDSISPHSHGAYSASRLCKHDLLNNDNSNRLTLRSRDSSETSVLFEQQQPLDRVLHLLPAWVRQQLLIPSKEASTATPEAQIDCRPALAMSHVALTDNPSITATFHVLSLQQTAAVCSPPVDAAGSRRDECVNGNYAIDVAASPTSLQKSLGYRSQPQKVLRDTLYEGRVGPYIHDADTSSSSASVAVQENAFATNALQFAVMDLETSCVVELASDALENIARESDMNFQPSGALAASGSNITRWKLALQAAFATALKDGEATTRVRMIFLDWQASRGPCFARFLCEQLLLADRGVQLEEALLLQTDSHMRFSPHFDCFLLRQLNLASRAAAAPESIQQHEKNSGVVDGSSVLSGNKESFKTTVVANEIIKKNSGDPERDETATAEKLLLSTRAVHLKGLSGGPARNARALALSIQTDKLTSTNGDSKFCRSCGSCCSCRCNCCSCCCGKLQQLSYSKVCMNSLEPPKVLLTAYPPNYEEGTPYWDWPNSLFGKRSSYRCAKQNCTFQQQQLLQPVILCAASFDSCGRLRTVGRPLHWYEPQQPQRQQQQQQGKQQNGQTLHQTGKLLGVDEEESSSYDRCGLNDKESPHAESSQRTKPNSQVFATEHLTSTRCMGNESEPACCCCCGNTCERKRDIASQSGTHAFSTTTCSSALCKVIPSLFWAAGFSFGPACVARDVGYDLALDYIFFGEEITRTLQLYTHGWQLYCPAASAVFHLWSRRHRPFFRSDLHTLCKFRTKSACGCCNRSSGAVSRLEGLRSSAESHAREAGRSTDNGCSADSMNIKKPIIEVAKESLTNSTIDSEGATVFPRSQFSQTSYKRRINEMKTGRNPAGQVAAKSGYREEPNILGASLQPIVHVSNATSDEFIEWRASSHNCSRSSCRSYVLHETNPGHSFCERFKAWEAAEQLVQQILAADSRLLSREALQMLGLGLRKTPESFWQNAGIDWHARRLSARALRGGLSNEDLFLSKTSEVDAAFALQLAISYLERPEKDV